MSALPAALADRCPLCGQANQCAMELERVTGEQQPPCWCTTVNFADELLARVPPTARGRACICAACAMDVARERRDAGKR